MNSELATEQRPEYLFQAKGLLHDSRICVTAPADADKDFNVVVRGTPGFFRLVTDLPNGETLSANRNSGMYFYLNGKLVGKTRRPGSLTRVWLGNTTHHYNLSATDEKTVVVERNNAKLATAFVDRDHLHLEFLADAPQTLLAIWLLAALRLVAPRRGSGRTADQIRNAMKHLEHPNPWLTLAVSQPA